MTTELYAAIDEAKLELNRVKIQRSALIAEAKATREKLDNIEHWIRECNSDADELAYFIETGETV
jgi:phage shock protein A